MPNNHKNKLIKRVYSDTSLMSIIDKSVGFDTKLKIQECVDKRVFNKYTQKDIADKCNVSLATIKRFENCKIDSLSLYLNYVFLLEGLPNKKSKRVPKWVYQ